MKNDLHFCENCGHEFQEQAMELQKEGYGWWCNSCLEQTPGDVTGYCPLSCQLGGGCDQSC